MRLYFIYFFVLYYVTFAAETLIAPEPEKLIVPEPEKRPIESEEKDIWDTFIENLTFDTYNNMNLKNLGEPDQISRISGLNYDFYFEKDNKVRLFQSVGDVFILTRVNGEPAKRTCPDGLIACTDSIQRKLNCIIDSCVDDPSSQTSIQIIQQEDSNEGEHKFDDEDIAEANNSDEFISELIDEAFNENQIIPNKNEACECGDFCVIQGDIAGFMDANCKCEMSLQEGACPNMFPGTIGLLAKKHKTLRLSKTRIQIGEDEETIELLNEIENDVIGDNTDESLAEELSNLNLVAESEKDIDASVNLEQVEDEEQLIYPKAREGDLEEADEEALIENCMDICKKEGLNHECPVPLKCQLGQKEVMTRTESDNNGCSCCSWSCENIEVIMPKFFKPSIENNEGGLVAKEDDTRENFLPKDELDSLLNNLENEDTDTKFAEDNQEFLSKINAEIIERIEPMPYVCGTCCAAPPPCPMTQEAILGTTDPDENGCTCCLWSCEDVVDLVGGDKDDNGCIGSAGFTWCEKKSKCLQEWEEACDDGLLVAEFSDTFLEPMIMPYRCVTCCAAPPPCPPNQDAILGYTDPDENGCTCCSWSSCQDVVADENSPPEEEINFVSLPSDDNKSIEISSSNFDILFWGFGASFLFCVIFLAACKCTPKKGAHLKKYKNLLIEREPELTPYRLEENMI